MGRGKLYFKVVIFCIDVYAFSMVEEACGALVVIIQGVRWFNWFGKGK